MRFFAADGAELLPRKDRVWAEPALIDRTSKALVAAEIAAPLYFQALVAETTGGRLEEALFSML